MEHRRACAAPLARPIAQTTILTRYRVSFLLPHALRFDARLVFEIWSGGSVEVGQTTGERRGVSPTWKAHSAPALNAILSDLGVTGRAREGSLYFVGTCDFPLELKPVMIAHSARRGSPLGEQPQQHDADRHSDHDSAG